MWENSFLNPLTWRGTREPRALFVPRDHQPRGDCAEPRKPESSRQEELCGQGSSPTVPSPLQWAQSALRDPALTTRDTPHSRDGTRPTWQVEVQMWEWTQPYSKHLKQRWTEQKIIFFHTIKEDEKTWILKILILRNRRRFFFFPKWNYWPWKPRVRERMTTNYNQNGAGSWANYWRTQISLQQTFFVF